jgi:phage-related minor tail protein
VFELIGIDIIQGLIDGMIGLLETAWDTFLVQPFNAVVDTIANFFGVGKGKSSNSSPLFTIGAQIIGTFVDGIDSAKGGVTRAVTAIINAIPDLIMDLLSEHSPSGVLFDLGQNAIQGLINGIDSLYDDVVALVASLTEDVIDTTNDKLKNGSPSKVYDVIGRNMMLGMVNGINRTSGSVNKAISDAIGSRLSSGRMSVNASVSAMPVSGGNTVTFGDVYVNERIDLATLKSYVQQMILEN